MTKNIQTQTLPSGFGSYLLTILPADVATACGAFSSSMQQIKNISQVPIEKFAQVVSSVETTKDLDIGGTNVPVDTTLASSAKSTLARGSGLHGTYTMGDFFGCMTGTPYNYRDTEAALNALDTTALSATYTAMVALLSGGGPYDVALQALITTAAGDIAAIQAAQPTESAYLTKLWDAIGTQLQLEQTARFAGLGNSPIVDSNYPNNPNPGTQIAFVDMIGDFSKNVEPHMYAQSLESMADWSTVGGRSIIGLMRELRNAARLHEVGIELDNTIPDSFTEKERKTLIANGVNNFITPSAATSPQALGYYNPDTDEYVITNGVLANRPLDTGLAGVPGSLAGTSYSDLIPPELNSIYSSKQLSNAVYSVTEALDEVERCNCDCW